MINVNYKSFIKGKRVAFVGGCPNIKGMDKGADIDDFDIVIKTNGSVFFDSEEYYRDYGKRIDVLYTNVQFAREMYPLPVVDFKREGIKWMCMKNCSATDRAQYSKYLNVRTIEHIIVDVRKVLPSANNGAHIFTDILRCEPAEFYITGLDFFASKRKAFKHNNYQEYLPGYLPDKIRHQGNKINIGKNEDGHNFKDNAFYVWDLFIRHPNFKTDPFIHELLHSIIMGEVDQEND